MLSLCLLHGAAGVLEWQLLFWVEELGVLLYTVFQTACAGSPSSFYGLAVCIPSGQEYFHIILVEGLDI